MKFMGVIFVYKKPFILRRMPTIQAITCVFAGVWFSRTSCSSFVYGGVPKFPLGRDGPRSYVEAVCTTRMQQASRSMASCNVEQKMKKKESRPA